MPINELNNLIISEDKVRSDIRESRHAWSAPLDSFITGKWGTGAGKKAQRCVRRQKSFQILFSSVKRPQKLRNGGAPSQRQSRKICDSAHPGKAFFFPNPLNLTLHRTFTVRRHLENVQESPSQLLDCRGGGPFKGSRGLGKIKARYFEECDPNQGPTVTILLQMNLTLTEGALLLFSGTGIEHPIGWPLGHGSFLGTHWSPFLPPWLFCLNVFDLKELCLL